MSRGNGEAVDTATQAVLYGFSTILQVALQVATMMIISRSLGPSNYGIYTLALLPSSILSAISDPGITSSMFRYVSTARARGDECTAAYSYRFSLLILSAINTILLALIALYPRELGVLLAQREGLDALIIATAPYPLASTLYSAALAYYAGVEKAFLRSFLQLLAPLLRLILVSTALLMGLSVQGVILAHVATYVVMALICILLSIREVEIAGSCSPAFKPRDFLALSLSIYLIGLSGLLVYRVIGFLVAYTTRDLGLEGDLQVGNYNAASALLGAVTSVLGSLAIPLTPLLAKRAGDQFRDTAVVLLDVLFALAVPLTAYAFFFADSLLYSVYGRSYTLAPLFFRYMSISMIAWPIQAVYGAIYWILEDKKPLALYGLAILSSGLLLAFPLSLVMRLQGIAVAQGLYPLVSSLVLAYYGSYKYKVNPSLRRVSMILAVSIALLMPIRYLTLSLQYYIAQALVGFTLYAIEFTVVGGLIGDRKSVV